MVAFGKLLLFGFLLWLTVFISSFIIFPLKASNPPFFETLISIFLVLFTVIASHLYFSKTLLSVKSALYAGITWMMVNIIIDLPLFSFGPMKKDIADYFTDIGLTYIIIPIITTGLAAVSVRSGKLKKTEKMERFR